MKINSPQNSKVKELALLSTNKGRKQLRQYILEGNSYIEDAINADMNYITLVHCPELCPLPEKVNKSLVLEVSEKVFKKISDMETPQGLALVLPIPEHELSSSIKENSKFVLCYEIQDPGNMGTIIRTALLAGFKGVISVNSTDPYSPKVVRSSAGCITKLPVYAHTWNEIINISKSHNLQLIASVASGGIPYYDFDWPTPFVILVGNESKGLSKKVISDCKFKLNIPTSGESDSLNAAISGAILMFESIRPK